jgi:hypothetical protein
MEEGYQIKSSLTLFLVRRLETSSGEATALSALLATNDDTFTCHDFRWYGFS